MKEISCRPAELTDLPILYEFEQGIVEAERPFDDTLQSGSFHYYDLHKMIESKNTEVIVAISNEEVIGSAYISIRKAKAYVNYTHFGYLGFMFVRPQFRGMGVNRIIIDELIAWAKQKNINELQLDVYEGNHSAIRAYEKAGFKKNLINMRIEI